MKKKPIVSWYKNFDPTYDLSWVNLLTDINIINTKNFNKEFVDVCLKHKDKIFLHVYLNGMGGSTFEPNIPSVKYMFESLKYLVNNGFPIKQIKIIISPILPNDNGLNALKLLLRLLTEYKELKLRWVRFIPLSYKSNIDLSPRFKADAIKIQNKNKFGGRFVISNDNILKRKYELNKVLPYLINISTFFTELNNIKNKYSSIINIDDNDEAIIGIRELMAFGYNNNWKNDDGTVSKIITYEHNNKLRPQVNIISKHGSKTIRCKNKCILCPFLY